MSSNFERYFDKNGDLKEGILADNLWLKYLTQTDNVYVNAERLESMGSLSGKETLMYVMRTLDILDEIKERESLSADTFEAVRLTLMWSEVAKGGLETERKEWIKKGYPLDIHNIASAEIYKDATGDTGLVYTLIRTHGVVGQSLRGEISFSGNKDLLGIKRDDFKALLMALNQKKNREGHSWEVKVHNFVDETMEPKVGSVIFSSILHEIYSYTETENGRFEIDSVKKALRNAYDSLDKGGRIIIRDGVKTEGSAVRKIRFKTAAGLDFFKNYMTDFKGLKDIPEDKKVTGIDEETLTVTGDINFIREFLFTYTWGSESYAHEVQEQFGYFTLEEYKNFFKELGAELVFAEQLLEPGYPDNLGKYLELLDEKGEVTEYPDSNCIIVAQKQ